MNCFEPIVISWNKPSFHFSLDCWSWGSYINTVTSATSDNAAVDFQIPIPDSHSTAKTESVPAFAASVEEFDTLLGQITTKDKEQMGKTAGKVASKDEAEEALIAATMIVSSALIAYARNQGNTQLKEKARVSESYIRRVRSNEQLNIANLTYDLGSANVAGIEQYGISAPMLADLKSRIGVCEAALKEVGSGFTEQVGARTAVSDLFVQADEILKEELDPMVETIRIRDPELYSGGVMLWHASAFLYSTRPAIVRLIEDIGVRRKKGQKAAAGSPN